MIGHFTDDQVVLDFIGSESLMRLAALGTSCPDHFLRTKVSPMVVNLPITASLEEVVIKAHEVHAQYRQGYADYYNRYATAQTPAMRGADPLIILIPGIGMFSYGKDKHVGSWNVRWN